MPTYTIKNSNGDVLLAGAMPEAEYMYGCTPTALGMLLGYYDLYGYRGTTLDNIIEGDVALKSRGTDGDAYDMDAFDTVLGKAIASKEYVYRFHSRNSVETKPAQELEYTFKEDGKTLNTDEWNCIADYIGTGQFWRGLVLKIKPCLILPPSTVSLPPISRQLVMPAIVKFLGYVESTSKCLIGVSSVLPSV